MRRPTKKAPTERAYDFDNLHAVMIAGLRWVRGDITNEQYRSIIIDVGRVIDRWRKQRQGKH